jgi:hypothetical protein
MNVSTHNSARRISKVLMSQNAAASATGAMDSTGISPLAVMAQLLRLRWRDPVQFKSVMSSISSVLSGRRTSSPTTVGVGAAGDAEKTFLMAARTRRWPVTMFGGVVLVAAAALLVRPSHNLSSRPIAGAGSVVPGPATLARAIVPGRQEALGKPPRLPVAVSSKTSADFPAPPPAVAGALLATNLLGLAPASPTTEAVKRTHQSARRTVSPPTTTKEWSSDERWLAH